jgi:hypothetical protein
MLTWAMHLTLLVPGLLWPREILRDTTFDLPLPALSLLLGRGRRLRLADEAAWLAGAFGLAAPLPAASLRLLGDGGVPGNDDWLCLDPVGLRIGERTIVMDDPATLALQADEDAALRQLVAPLLADLGELVAPHPGRWHLRLLHPVRLEAPSLAAAVGRQLAPDLPGGADGRAWRHRLAELQTLLHAHPVNRARLAAGRPTVDSLWPWGGGRLPATAAASFTACWTREPLLAGLARLAGLAPEGPPQAFSPAAGRVLARLDALEPALATFSADAWRQDLVGLESRWFAPAAAALRDGRLDGLCLIGGGHEAALRVDIRRRDLWRFWRKPLPLAEALP